jgi:hypothetical protein
VRGHSSGFRCSWSTAPTSALFCAGSPATGCERRGKRWVSGGIMVALDAARYSLGVGPLGYHEGCAHGAFIRWSPAKELSANDAHIHRPGREWKARPQTVRVHASVGSTVMTQRAVAAWQAADRGSYLASVGTPYLPSPLRSSPTREETIFTYPDQPLAGKVVMRGQGTWSGRAAPLHDHPNPSRRRRKSRLVCSL